MFVQFLWENPPHDAIDNVPEASVNLNGNAGGKKAITVGPMFFDKIENIAWLIWDLPECPAVGTKIYVPDCGFLTVHEIYLSNPPGEGINIAYQCICSDLTVHCCSNCKHWQLTEKRVGGADDYSTGFCRQIKESSDEAWFEIEGSGSASLQTSENFSCNLWAKVKTHD